jgi:hypothetical protein
VAEVWGGEPCAQWPGNGARDRYTGPWNRPAACTILLLGITGDAALPYKDGLAMAHDLARARLLTVRGYGHTEISSPSTCATNYERSYLQTGALPSVGVGGVLCAGDPAFGCGGGTGAPEHSVIVPEQLE